MMALFDADDFEISVPQCPTRYSPMANGDVLYTADHQNA
jgi:hypothetical protein